MESLFHPMADQLAMYVSSPVWDLQALLKELRRNNPRFIYLDCGLRDVKTPELMAQALREVAKEIPPILGLKVVRGIGSAVSRAFKLLPKGPVSSDQATAVEDALSELIDDFFPEDKASDLTAVINSFERLLSLVPKGVEKPVIVIGTTSLMPCHLPQEVVKHILNIRLFAFMCHVDEVNALKQWKVTEKGSLTTFLGFVKRACKQEKWAHLILATSETFMVSWLENREL